MMFSVGYHYVHVHVPDIDNIVVNILHQMPELEITTQLTFNCSKLIIKALEKGVKYVKSQK